MNQRNNYKQKLVTNLTSSRINIGEVSAVKKGINRNLRVRQLLYETKLGYLGIIVYSWTR